MSLDATDLEAVRGVVAELMIKPPVSEAILTLAEAKAYTKHATAAELQANPEAGRTAFYAWCREFHVKSGRNARFAKSQLDRGLSAEARKVRFAQRRTRRPAAAAGGSK